MFGCFTDANHPCVDVMESLSRSSGRRPCQDSRKEPRSAFGARQATWLRLAHEIISARNEYSPWQVQPLIFEPRLVLHFSQDAGLSRMQ